MAGVRGNPLIQFKVNGVEREFDSDSEMPLLWYLRDILGLTGTKFGWAWRGAEPAVHQNGEAICSCVTAVKDVAGAEIVTIEGISEAGLHPVEEAWMECHSSQCGYCQAGPLMGAIALLKSKPKPTDKDIDEAMAGNIRRRGAYRRIRAFIKAASAPGATT